MNTKEKEILEGLDLYSDLQDERDLDECDQTMAYVFHNECDSLCDEGYLCPDCLYEEYLLWIKSHGHCETGSWDCPDEGDCPWVKDLFDFKESEINS